jgi:hypothetical protein
MKLRLAISGSSGYLARQLMAQLGADPDCEFILGLDVRRREFQLPCAAEFLQFDLTVPWELLAEFWTKRRINTGLHLAWQFNPPHDGRRQREVDVQGSLNFLRAAAAEFQKILDHPGLALNEPIGVLAHLGLARAYAFQGDTAKSRMAYQDFLALWKDADPDIPILQQAKAEYAKIQ